ncbi:hypothetical protein B5X24_HaOG210871 [Helicoverpa armigera]|uniref:Uncharacterized protein n=1 Tax=Helicoverpa armigera TaxID=29058 RepID=A0A2W1BHG1_HELAM|nr:hypothetical protein B5X24_HaOG210871 [Helicoverpa armigera]
MEYSLEFLDGESPANPAVIGDSNQLKASNDETKSPTAENKRTILRQHTKFQPLLLRFRRPKERVWYTSRHEHPLEDGEHIFYSDKRRNENESASPTPKWRI